MDASRRLGVGSRLQVHAPHFAFDDEAGVGNAAGTCPVGDVQSRAAGASLVSAFVEIEHRDPWVRQDSDLGVAQRRQMAVTALDPAGGWWRSGSSANPLGSGVV